MLSSGNKVIIIIITVSTKLLPMPRFNAILVVISYYELKSVREQRGYSYMKVVYICQHV